MRFIKCGSAFALTLFLAGCFGKYQISNLGKPVPPEYTAWNKPGSNLQDVKKIMLECGAPSPSPNEYSRIKYGNSLGREVDHDEWMNLIFTYQKCMSNAGLIWNYPYTLQELCSWDRHKNYPACQPGAVIPKPSVERRLNSWHCKLELDYDYCLKHAVRPSLCRPDDFMHPPPECRP